MSRIIEIITSCIGYECLLLKDYVTIKKVKSPSTKAKVIGVQDNVIHSINIEIDSK